MSDTSTLNDFLELMKKASPDFVKLATASTPAEFENAFLPYLEQAIIDLETNKKLFDSLLEDGLSSIICIALNKTGLHCTREQNSNGHVDLTITSKHSTPEFKKLGEAKIYRGPEYHIDGVGQLLQRYTTGRETCGVVLSYVKKENVKQLVEKLRQVMDKKLPYKQTGPCTDSPLKWSFLSNHEHSSGENLDLRHVGCNLFSDA